MGQRSRPFQFNFYLSADEKNQLEKLKREFNGTQSELLRTILFNSDVAALNESNKVIADLIKEVSAIGNNLNQIARAVNSGDTKIENEALFNELLQKWNKLWLLLKQ